MADRLDTSGSDYILCPFYKRHEAVRISCESDIPGAIGCVHSYACKADREEIMHEYCEKNYEKCEHYRSVMKNVYG